MCNVAEDDGVEFVVVNRTKERVSKKTDNQGE